MMNQELRNGHRIGDPEAKALQRDSRRWAKRVLHPGDWPLRVQVSVGLVGIIIVALAAITYTNARTLQVELRRGKGLEFEILASSQISHLADILSEQLAVLRGIALVDQVRVSTDTANGRYIGSDTDIEAQLAAMNERWQGAADDSQLVQSVVNPELNLITAQLFRYIRALPDHLDILITDRYGGLLAATRGPLDYCQADEPWWQAAYNGGRGGLYISQPEYDESTGTTVLVMAAPIMSESGQFIGVVRSTFRLDPVYQAVSRIEIGETGHVTLIDSTGQPVAAPHLEEAGAHVPASWYGTDVLGTSSGWREGEDEQDRPALLGYAAIRAAEIEDPGEAAAIHALDWVLIVHQTQSEAYAPVSRAVFTSLLIIVVLILTTIGLVFFIVRGVVTPITELAVAARRMAAGELDVRAPESVEVRRRDEVGELATAFNRMADQIASIVTTLEQRIAERTRGLQAATEVSRAITLVLDPEELLQRVVDLARDRFNLYYVGLFLVDEQREWAVLRAGTGEAGRIMLQRGHRLGVGSDSMIGQCVARDEARIALDVGEEAVRFVNPYLPDTRSEMALPLRARGQVIGAMTVQSVEEAAFDDADIAVLQTMADQVAVALDNARLFAEVQTALADLEATHRRYLGQAWAEYLHAGQETGAPLAYQTVQSADGTTIGEMPSELYQAVEEARPVALAPDAELRTPSSEPQDHSALAAPITLRDVVIGALGVHVDGERRWTDDDISLVEAIAERASLAADNLRLLEETQRALGETEALYRASQAIGAAANLADIGQALVDFAAVSGVDAARVLMFEHDEQGQPVTMIWRESWTVDDRPAQPYGARLDLDDYPLAVLMDASEPLVVEDVLSDPRANQATRTLVTTVSGLRSFVMVPIAIGERWFGMLFAGRNRPGSFSEELIRGYTTLSGQAAVALESMRLLEETRRTAERERLISQVTTRVRETLDMETMLKTAAQEIRRVLDLPEVVVRLAPRRPDGDGNGAGGL